MTRDADAKEPKGQHVEKDYQRPNGRWQIQFYDTAGKERCETFNTEDRAKRMPARRIAQRDAGSLESATEARVRIDTLAESYKLHAKNSAPKSYWSIELVWRVHRDCHCAY